VSQTRLVIAAVLLMANLLVFSWIAWLAWSGALEPQDPAAADELAVGAAN
jgi:hypothetical protein